MTATIPHGEYWVGNESVLNRLLNDAGQITDAELNSRLAVFSRVECNTESLCCLLALARRNYFTEDYKNAFKTVAQIEVKRIREAWAAKKEDCESVKGDDNSLSAKLFRNLANSFAGEMNFLFSAVKEISDIHLQSEKVKESPEDEFFFKKVKADYSRYRAEIVKNAETIKDAVTYNDEILEHATSLGFPPNHPSLLGVVLNCSVHYKETLGDTNKAIEFAELHLNNCKALYADPESRAENDKGACILRLMEENLDLWRQELKEEAAVSNQA